MNSTKNMQTLALALAREAHEDNFESHRGIGRFADFGLLYFYDNHPYADDETRRPLEHAEIHVVLAAAGADLVATASWPPPGDEQPGYTIAHVYRCIDDEHARRAGDALKSRYPAIVRGTLRPLN